MARRINSENNEEYFYEFKEFVDKFCEKTNLTTRTLRNWILKKEYPAFYKQKYTEQQIQDLTNDIMAGMTYRQMSIKYNINTTELHKFAKQYLKKFKKNTTATKRIVEDMKKDYSTGEYNYNQLAKKYNKSYQWVYSRLNFWDMEQKLTPMQKTRIEFFKPAIDRYNEGVLKQKPFISIQDICKDMGYKYTHIRYYILTYMVTAKDNTLQLKDEIKKLMK